MTTILIRADFNRRLSDELQKEAENNELQIDRIIEASDDEVLRYKPSIIPSIIAAADCGCKYLEVSELVDVARFEALKQTATTTRCDCLRRKLEIVEYRLSKAIQKRAIALELDLPDLVSEANSEIESLKEDWRGLHK